MFRVSNSSESDARNSFGEKVVPTLDASAATPQITSSDRPSRAFFVALYNGCIKYEEEAGNERRSRTITRRRSSPKQGGHKSLEGRK